jgi:hypothetical protein
MQLELITRRAIVIQLAIEFRVNLMIYFGSLIIKKENDGENQDGCQA